MNIEHTRIVITLETKEEADYLWHRLNCSVEESFVDYSTIRGLQLEDSVLATYMWEELNKIHRPVECQ